MIIIMIIIYFFNWNLSGFLRAGHLYINEFFPFHLLVRGVFHSYT